MHYLYLWLFGPFCFVAGMIMCGLLSANHTLHNLRLRCLENRLAAARGRARELQREVEASDTARRQLARANRQLRESLRDLRSEYSVLALQLQMLQDGPETEPVVGMGVAG